MSTARLLALSIVLLQPYAAAAQQLPGYSGPTSGAHAEWLVHTRAAAERSLQNWVNLTETGAAPELATLFTDGGLLVDGTGRRAEGRAAVQELLAELPARSNVLLQVTGVAAGSRIMNVTGRVAYREGGFERVELMTAVLELHRDYWLYRLLAFAPLTGGAAAVQFEDALGAGRTRTVLPQRASVRVVLEPTVVRGPGELAAGGDGWVGFGGGVGIELDRALELRATAWRGAAGSPAPAGDGGAVSGFGAELRGYMLPAASTRPYLSLGLAKLTGPAPDSAMVPHIGTGLAIRLARDFDLQLGLRDYLVSADGALYPSSSWFTRKREHRFLFGVGVSYSTGRDAVWRDAELSPIERSYQATEMPGVRSFVSRWAALVSTGARTPAGAMYSPFATLFQPGGELIRGASELAAFWVDAAGGTRAEIRDGSVSGAAAWVDLDLTAEGRPTRRVFTMLERSGGVWMIQNQVLRH